MPKLSVSPPSPLPNVVISNFDAGQSPSPFKIGNWFEINIKLNLPKVIANEIALLGLPKMRVIFGKKE